MNVDRRQAGILLILPIAAPPAHGAKDVDQRHAQVRQSQGEEKDLDLRDFFRRFDDDGDDEKVGHHGNERESGDCVVTPIFHSFLQVIAGRFVQPQGAIHRILDGRGGMP